MNNIQIRRGLKTVALLSVLGLAVTGLSQCRMVGDSVTGVDLNAPQGTSDRSECIQACNDRFKAATAAEVARHNAALRSCGVSGQCKKAEDQVHQDIQQKNVDDMQNCKRGCYNEGSGGGGR